MFGWLKVLKIWKTEQPPSDEQIRKLSTLVLSRDSRTRADAAAALGRSHDPRAVAPLIEALKNPITKVSPASDGGGKDDLPPSPKFTRYETYYIEDALVMLGAPAVEPLLELTHRLRFREEPALRILVRIGDPRTVDLLVEALDVRMLRNNAEGALARIGDARIIDPLLKMWARKPAFLPSPWFMELVGKIGDKRCIEPLVIALVSVLPNERESVAKTLNQIDPAWPISSPAQALMARLISQLLSPDRPQRRAALGGLDQIDPGWSKSGPARAAFPSVVAALKDGDFRLRVAAAEALRGLKDQRAVPDLVEALADDNQEVRCAAAMALGAIGDPRAVEPLIAALRHPDEWLRRMAAEVLGDLRDTRAVEPLRNAAGSDPHGATRDAAAKSLAKLVKEH